MSFSLLEIIRRSESYLASKGIERARREAEEVIADALGLKRLELYLQFDRPLKNDELSKLRSVIQRRALREPPAYIAGQVTFAGLTLQVSPHVLIPRPETEILVEKITQTLQALPLENKILWDMCCGSGCIGLALKHRFPQLKVILSDLSEQAIAIAQQNSRNAVEFKVGDLFAPFAGQKCDFFVCNPPYISNDELSNLSPEVKDWEPKMALVGGKTGLEFYERIALELADYLNEGGMAWLELGTGQGEAVRQLFSARGFSCVYEQDWSGHDRFFSAHKTSSSGIVG